MADVRIQSSEEMVGASHATKSDTLNRITLISHTVEGDIKTTASVGSAGATLANILCGDMKIVLSPNSLGSKASSVTAAASLSFVQSVTITLQTASNKTHYWNNMTFTAASSEAVVDSDVAVPTLSTNSPVLVNGSIIMTMTYDTDASATKVYSPGDCVYMTISAPTILGYTIIPFTLTDSLT